MTTKKTVFKKQKLRPARIGGFKIHPDKRFLRENILNELACLHYKNYSSWEKLKQDFGFDGCKKQVEQAVDLTIKKMAELK